MGTFAEIIAAWRSEHPDERVTEKTLLDILGLETLQGVNLRGANLWGTDQVLSVTGLPSGTVNLVPTWDGWVLAVGCWTGTPQSLRELVAQDDGWPEAKGKEVSRRRPGLVALADLADAHIAAHPGVIEDLAKRWGTGVSS